MVLCHYSYDDVPRPGLQPVERTQASVSRAADFEGAVLSATGAHKHAIVGR